jgi:type VI secretion system protein ImpC
MMSSAEPSKGPAAKTTAEEGGLLDTILKKGMRARDDSARDRGRELLKEFVEQLLDPSMTVAKDTEKTINLRIAEIDRLLSSQLNEIMHHPDFQKLEGSWRGLHYLVHQTETGTQLKLRVLNVSKSDLLKDMERASEFDQSALFKQVYEDEYGIAGGFPYGALVGDYEFGKHPQDVDLLERISNVAAAAHAPFLSAAAPQLFGWDGFTELGGPRDLAKIFETNEYVKWRSFRDSEDSRYVGLTLPHTLGRLPYGKETVPVEAFNFEEDVDGKDHHKYLWSNAAYALGTRLTDSIAKYGWLATIRGYEGGGLVEGLPTHTFATDEGEVALKCPTEIAITDRREKELSDLGFIPLCHYKGTDYAVFFATQSCQKPKLYDRDEANANARLSTMLQYILCTSRFAHYLKTMARDKIGAFMERNECEDWLQRWINNYCLASPENAGPEQKARRPLREAKIEVREVKGKPGCYEATAWLRPHFQLDELTMSMRLVAELPESKGG